MATCGWYTMNAAVCAAVGRRACYLLADPTRHESNQMDGCATYARWCRAGRDSPAAGLLRRAATSTASVSCRTTCGCPPGRQPSDQRLTCGTDSAAGHGRAVRAHPGGQQGGWHTCAAAATNLGCRGAAWQRRGQHVLATCSTQCGRSVCSIDTGFSMPALRALS